MATTSKEINYKEVGQRIVDKRREQALTQGQLAKNGGFDHSTLNQLEQGKKKVSAKYIERLSKVLGVSSEFLLYGVDEFKIGFGFSHNSSPLFLMINERQIPTGFKLTYNYRNDHLEFYSKEDDYPSYEEKAKYQYHSAPWLIDEIVKGSIHMIFVPYGTYKFKTDHLVRLCSIMNTAKGGLLALICTSKKEIKKVPIQDILKEIKGRKDTKITFLKDTVAEDFFNHTFLTPAFNSVFIPDQLESKKSLPDLIEDIGNNLIKNIKANAEYAIFIGWEPHVTEVKTQIEKKGVKCKVADQCDFVSSEDPFFHITVDCIIKSEKLSEYKNNEQIKQFLIALKESVEKLNGLKNFRGAHYKIRDLAERLLMHEHPNEAYEALHKINFEFSTDII